METIIIKGKEKMRIMICSKCNHRFAPRVKNPVKCPRCQNPFYKNKPKEKLISI